VRLTELRDRLDVALGPAYSGSWAQDYVLADLGGRTVEQALAAGLAAADIWRTVHAELGLPARLR
jgi:hypothetical protein